MYPIFIILPIVNVFTCKQKQNTLLIHIFQINCYVEDLRISSVGKKKLAFLNSNQLVLCTHLLCSRHLQIPKQNRANYTFIGANKRSTKFVEASILLVYSQAVTKKYKLKFEMLMYIIFGYITKFQAFKIQFWPSSLLVDGYVFYPFR